MVDSENKQQYITVIGSNFLGFAIWDLIKESFSTYLKTDFSKKRFQTSIWEHTHAAAAIVLSVIRIEAYRNRIYCLEKEKVSRSVPDDLCNILAQKEHGFTTDKLKDIGNELFARIKKSKAEGRTLTLKIKYADFEQITRSKTVNKIINTPELINKIALELLHSITPINKKIRLIGLTVSNFYEKEEKYPLQLTLEL